MLTRGSITDGRPISELALALLLSALVLVAARGQTSTRTDADVAREIDRLQNKDESIRDDAEEKLIRMGARAVPALAAALHDRDPRVRLTADLALDRIGPDAKAAVPDLVAALHDPNSTVSDRAAAALISIGPAAVPALIPALHDPNPNIRAFAARVFSRSGVEANSAVPDLIAALHDPVMDRNAAAALVSIAASLRDNKRIDTISQLNQEAHELDAASFHAEAQRVRTAADLLEGYRRSLWLNPEAAIGKHPLTIALGAAYLILFLLCLFLLWLHPLALWRINVWLGADRMVKLPDWVLGLEISLANLLLVGLFRYHSRVLDAWVAEHIGNARQTFLEKRTVEERTDHVPVPLYDGQRIIEDEVELKRECLKPIFAQRRARLLVWGEGGSGKTSLACRIGHWAMAEDMALRLAAWIMLPVLIEEDLRIEVGKDKTVLTEMIRGQLKELARIDEAPPEGLVRHLLRQQRILLIVDGFSELSEATRDKLSPINPEFDANALLITSRQDEALGDVDKRILQPLRIEGGRLSSFMEAYLQQKGARTLFDDHEFFESCDRLTLIASGRDVTVLLARLFADQMIAAKRAQPDALSETLPQTVPELMLEYLSRLNSKKPQLFDNPTVQAAAKTICWECLRNTYRPASVSFQIVLAALTQADAGTPLSKEVANAQINYLKERLKVVQEVKGGSELKLTLDPLAEYLAALHLLEEYGDDKNDWRDFMKRADNTSGAPEAIKGFLLALRDCLLSQTDQVRPDDTRTHVRKFVVAELEKRAGVDPAFVKRLRLEQRTKDLISRLNRPFGDDRATAAEALGKLGIDAKTAISGLTRALKDSDARVRAKAAEALGSIGPEAKAAFPALSAAFGDDDESVRLNALKAAWSIAPEDTALLSATVAFLKDPGKGAVRVAAAMKLRQISPTEEALPALMDALDDKKAAPFAFQTIEKHWPEVVASIPAEKRRRYEEWRQNRPLLIPESDEDPWE